MPGALKECPVSTAIGAEWCLPPMVASCPLVHAGAQRWLVVPPDMPPAPWYALVPNACWCPLPPTACYLLPGARARCPAMPRNPQISFKFYSYINEFILLVIYNYHVNVELQKHSSTFCAFNFGKQQSP